jgi:hypothetical protein
MHQQAEGENETITGAMGNEYNNTEQIEKYLLNQLSGKELEAFNERLQEDPLLRQEVALQRKVIGMVELAEFKNVMEQSHREIARDEEQLRPVAAKPSAETHAPIIPLRRNTWLYYAIAASVLLLLVAGVVFYRSTVSATPLVTDIKYVVQRGEPGLGVAGVSAESTIPVKIYPPEANRNYHYRFDDTLRLYGNFEARNLTLLYNEPKEEYRLQDQQRKYVLERYQETAPLVEVPK